MTAALAGVTHPAAAHTELKSSTPKNGASVKKPPTKVELVFTESINRQFVRVVVTGPDGQKVGVGTPRTKGPVVTHSLARDLANGRYTIAFRVASSDGHPVRGTLRFTLAAPLPSPTATPTPASATPLTPTPAGSTPAAAGTSPAAATSAGGGGTTVVLVLAAVVVAALAVAAVIVRRRRPPGS